MTSRMNTRRLSTMVWTIALLLVMVMPALAQSLTQDEINALKMQLADAGNVHEALDARVQCYANQDNAFQERSKQLQQSAGGLHIEKDDLSSKLQKVQLEAEQFQHDYAQVQQNMNNLGRQMQKIEAQIRARQAALDKCKRQLGFLGFACDISGEIIGLNGELRRFSAESGRLKVRMHSTKSQLTEARKRQALASQELAQTQSELKRIERELPVIEAEIKAIKASLEKIRSVKQDYAVELRQFENALAEFERLDPASDRRYVVHRLRNESQDLDRHLVQARGMLDARGLQLPSGRRICAN